MIFLNQNLYYLIVEVTVSLIPNETKVENIKNDLRRSGKKKKKDRSTSSDEARGKTMLCKSL